jgi:crotonobetainyl-CoA:carnitine CoA-transferase CaiB-like acyl-CoA transferase
MLPLDGLLVVDLTRYLPGPFASRELLRLGARVVQVESPQGDPMRATAPAWHAALNAGKESVVCDLKAAPGLAQALIMRADIVLEGFRPGVAVRLGVGPESAAENAVYCSITGFGPDDVRAGHDLNYLGWAGVLADTAPALPPLPIADLAAGALGAVTDILAALLQRERSGRGSRLVVSMTHNAHRLVAHRLGGEPTERLLTGGLACYRIYECADGRHLTVGALEPKFFARLCELLDRPELGARHFDEDQQALADELAAAIRTRTLAEWLELFSGEDVCAGPVATRVEAAHLLGIEGAACGPELGEHTASWWSEVGASSRRPDIDR